MSADKIDYVDYNTEGVPTLVLKDGTRFVPPPHWENDPGSVFHAIMLTRKPRVPEIIVAAACLVEKLIVSIPRPARHHHILKAIFDATGKRRLSCVAPEHQGFLTSTGRFVDRKEACVIARANNQILTKTGPDDILFSEDLW